MISAPEPPVILSLNPPPLAVRATLSLFVITALSPVVVGAVTLASRADASTSRAVDVSPEAIVIVTSPALSSAPVSVITIFSTLVRFEPTVAAVASPTP